ncbi:MAG TPA: Asp23/Gls24 family envelope stress response protein [bacterium]|jgi:uncharacterized alkaline shock family protein YloU
MPATKSTATKTTKKKPAKKTAGKKTTTRKKAASKKVLVEKTPVIKPVKVDDDWDDEETEDYIEDLPLDPDIIADEDVIDEISDSISNLGSAGYINPTGTIYQQPVDGGYNIDKKVLAQIAHLASCEIDGLAPPKKDVVTRFWNMLNGRTDGIKVDHGATEAAIDIQVRVRYGADIPKITTDLRNVVSKRIWEMTGLRVVEANIRIQDVIPAPPGEEILEKT